MIWLISAWCHDFSQNCNDFVKNHDLMVFSQKNVTAIWFSIWFSLNHKLKIFTDLILRHPPETFSVTKYSLVWKFKAFQRWLKSFWINVAQFFSYCAVKKCESFWIFVWIFFSLKEDFKFWVGRNIVFRHFFYKCFQTISKNGHETTMLMETQK